MSNTTVSNASAISRTEDDVLAKNGVSAEPSNLGILAELIDADLEQVVGASHASGHLSAIY